MDVVVNWLVQGSVVAIVAAAALRVIPASQPHLRHALASVAFLLVAALPLLSLVLMPFVGAPLVASPSATLPLVSDSRIVALPDAWWTSPWLAVALGLVWCVSQACRFGVGARAVRRARRFARVCPPGVVARLPHFARLGTTGRRSRVVLSRDVSGAGVLGCGRPVIAVAPALVRDLDPADLDRVLVHEWAHVQRRDDVTQVLQQVGRAIAGWHPAAWWLDRQIAFEREAACDRIAVAMTGSAKRYAACLAALAARPRLGPAPLPMLAAAAPSRLRRRIMRILDPQPTPAAPRRMVAVAGAAALVICAVLASSVEVATARLTRDVGAIETTWSVASVASSIDRGTSERDVRDRRAQVIPVGDARDSRSVDQPLDAVAGPDVVASSDAVSDAPSPDDETAGTRQHMDQSTPVATSPSLDAPVVATPTTPPGAPTAQLGTSVAPDATTGPERVAAEAATTGADDAAALWTRAADAGVGLGRMSRDAGLAAAGFFSRFGRKVGDSFEAASAHPSRQSQ